MRLQHNDITTLLAAPCRLAWVARSALVAFTRRARATGALSWTHPCVLLTHQFDWDCRPPGRCGRTSSGWHLVRRKSQQTNSADLAETRSSRRARYRTRRPRGRWSRCCSEAPPRRSASTTPTGATALGTTAPPMVKVGARRRRTLAPSAGCTSSSARPPASKRTQLSQMFDARRFRSPSV